MFRRFVPVVLVGLVVPLVAGCQLADLNRNRLLVWHDWPEPEAAVLTELLGSYAEIDPDLELIVEYVPANQIESRFASEVGSGFGPDVLIGVDAATVAGLVAERAVHRITSAQVERHGFDRLDRRAMAAMSIDDTQRGIPLTGFTDVLYYREGILPPDTLDDIVDLAEDGYSTAIPMDFESAYWGIDAFEGSVFGDGGEVAPDDGYADWMRWLVAARRQPNIVLDGEYELLRDLFAEGKIDLFIGGSRELGTFRSMLQETGDQGIRGTGTDGDAGAEEAPPESIDEATPTLTNVGDLSFGLTTLPAGVNEAPGGLLDVEGMVINRHTDSLSPSLELMEYLTNVPSQGRIARSGVGRIPVNDSVSIDPTISPIEAALVVQQRRAVVLPQDVEHHRQELESVANDVYLQVTRGLLEPGRAGRVLTSGFEELKEDDDA